MLSLFLSTVAGFLTRFYYFFYPPILRVTANNEKYNDEKRRILKFGLLGATNIAPLAVIRACLTHSEAEVYAVAARDPVRAKEYAANWWNIPKVHTSYEDLLNDDEVDMVYIGLPPGLHYEWTMKALERGKHVLVEKPVANNAEDARRMFEYAESKGLVLMEAFHYRFHPCIQRVKEIVNSGELGKIKRVTAKLTVFAGAFPDTDFRYNLALGGGAFMDLGCYTLNILRYLTSSEPLRVASADCTPHVPIDSPPDFVPTVDRGINVTLEMPNDVTGVMLTDIAVPLKENNYIPCLRSWVLVECERGTIYHLPFVWPSLYHDITVTHFSDDGTKTARTEKAYVFPKDSSARVKGEDWWTTYRYQLEAFVDKIKGREPQNWITKEDSIANMDWIDHVYDKAGLGPRPNSQYVHPLSTNLLF